LIIMGFWSTPICFSAVSSLWPLWDIPAIGPVSARSFRSEAAAHRKALQLAVSLRGAMQ
jgi:hypothetical protein